MIPALIDTQISIFIGCKFLSYCLFRFGSFEIFKPTDAMTGRKGPSVGNKELLHKMLQYAISSFFPEVSIPALFQIKL